MAFNTGVVHLCAPLNKSSLLHVYRSFYGCKLAWLKVHNGARLNTNIRFFKNWYFLGRAGLHKTLSKAYRGDLDGVSALKFRQFTFLTSNLLCGTQKALDSMVHSVIPKPFIQDVRDPTRLVAQVSIV